MPEIIIRPAVNSEVESLTHFDHTIDTQFVWQMDELNENDAIRIFFHETRLPRSMKVQYPYNPSGLTDRWRFYALTLVATITNVPVAYISISTFQATRQLWVKDLVVDFPWRRQGLATALLRAVQGWGNERSFLGMLVEMPSKNFPMINLCKELGFQFCGFHDHYYDNGDIALFFKKQLKQKF